MLTKRLFKTALISFRHFTTAKSDFNFIGRKILTPTDLTAEELKSLIWTAMDLKTVYESMKKDVGLVKGARMTLLLKETNMFIQVPATQAASILKGHLNIIVDPAWDEKLFIEDTAKFLGLYSDIIFFQTKYQVKTTLMAESLKLPLVNIESARFRILRGLTDMMCLQLRYGHLKGLNLCWIGPATITFNTYLAMAPLLGLNVSYFCNSIDGKQVSPANLHDAAEICQLTLTNLQECIDPKAAIKDAHIIATSKHEDPSLKISLNLLNHANPEWSILHTLPRGLHEIDPEIVNHKNSLIFESAKNASWMWAAVMIRLLTDYHHVTERPSFENILLNK